MSYGNNRGDDRYGDSSSYRGIIIIFIIIIMKITMKIIIHLINYNNYYHNI